MKKTMIGLALSLALMLTAVSPAFALTGRDFGTHHSTHAIADGGFTRTMNPGMHQGYAGWPMH